MKVEKLTCVEFMPITITLETKEEATLMWCALNISEEVIRERLSTHKMGQMLSPDAFEIWYEMWSQYDDVFDPRRR